MVLLNADLRQIISIKESRKVLRYDELGIEYRALSAEAHTAQGLNPTLHICDELGQVTGPHSALFEALELATTAQRDPLTVVISTQSASDTDLLSALIDDGLNGHDRRSTCSLYAAPKDCTLDDEDALSAANPSYRLFMNRDEILAPARAALQPRNSNVSGLRPTCAHRSAAMPAREAAFRRYTLNQRIEQADPFVSPGLWESCHGTVAPLAELPALYAGLDLSAVNDLSAFVLVGKKGDSWHSHCRFWLPQDGLADKAAVDHAPYDVWARQGNLSTTPGRTIDYDFVAYELRELFRQHNILKVAFDPWHFDFFKSSLLHAGFTESVIAERFQEFAQTTKMMSPAAARWSCGPRQSCSVDVRVEHDHQNGRGRQPRARQAQVHAPHRWHGGADHGSRDGSASEALRRRSLDRLIRKGPRGARGEGCSRVVRAMGVRLVWLMSGVSIRAASSAGPAT